MSSVAPRRFPQLPRIGDYLDYYAERTPENDFLLHDELRLSYREAKELVDACARALLASGIGPGDRVAAYSFARPEYFVTFLAAANIGAIWLGLNPKYTPEELEYNVGDAGSRLLFSFVEDQEHRLVLEELRRRQSSIERLVFLQESDGLMSFAAFMREGDDITDDVLEAARLRVATMDPAAVVYTSGSSGRPKGALIPHRGLTYCSAIQGEYWVTFESLRILCDLPINHVGCLGDICCSTLVAGGALFFMERFNPAGALAVIERERLTLWAAVPTMFLLATQIPEWESADLSSLRRIVWSGAAAPEALIEKLQRIGVPLSSSYGMTETVGSVTYSRAGDSLEVLANTIGRPDPRYEVRIERPDGTTCAPGEEGEVVVRGDFVTLGYLNRPEATAELFRGGWLHTGDAAVLRPDGNIQLVGRLTDMFKSGGYNVYCREVEAALEQHPAVEMASVVGTPDDLYGEVGVAFIVSALEGPLGDDLEGPLGDDLKQFALEHLANYKVPKRFVVVNDLPRLAVGKVDKRALRERALQARA